MTKLRKKSIKEYFISNCNLNRSPKHFWNTIKPFMSTKYSSQNGNITLFENDRIQNNTQDVCNIFNSHFSTCANSIGHSQPLSDSDSIRDIISVFDKHSSVASIKANSSEKLLISQKLPMTKSLNFFQKLILKNLPGLIR